MSKFAQRKKGKDWFSKIDSKLTSWWFILPFLVFLWWSLQISYRTLYNFNPWFIIFILAGFITGIIYALIHKTPSLSKRERLVGYSIIFTFVAMLVCLFLTTCIEWSNYYFISNNNITYSETTWVIRKSSRRYTLTLDFKQKDGKQSTINVTRHFYDEISVGDKCVLTLQEGFWGIPVIKDMKRGEE